MKFANSIVLNFLNLLVFRNKIAYLCTNRTHSASRKISKWVFFFLAPFNTPSLPLYNAHLEGLFFLAKPIYSLKIRSYNG